VRDPESLDLDEVRGALARALARICPPWLAAERDDLAQNAFLRLLELEQRKGPDALTAAGYVWRTAYSVVVDEIRRRRRDRADGSDVEVLPGRGHGDPERTHTAREAARALRACLAALAEPRRVAVMLHLQGHPRLEAAALAGWAAKRFENLAYRGLADLRRCLEQKGVRP